MAASLKPFLCQTHKTEKPLQSKRLRYFYRLSIDKISLIFLFKIMDFAVNVV